MESKRSNDGFQDMKLLNQEIFLGLTWLQSGKTTNFHRFFVYNEYFLNFV